MILLTLRSPLSPAGVLDALRTHGGEWRESRIPETLRRAGVLSVECRLQGSTCTLSCRRRWYGPVERARMIRVRAKVLPNLEGDGTVVQVSARYSTRTPLLAAISFGLFVVAGVMFSRLPAWLIAGLAVGAVGFQYILLRDANWGLSRAGEPEADYLIRRVEEVVGEAGAASPSAPASYGNAELDERVNDERAN